MKRAFAIAFVAVLLSGMMASAQTPPPAPKPGPEQKNLAYFVGTWTVTGDLKPGAMGPGGKTTGSDHIEWMPGGFFLVSHTQESGPMGKDTALAVYGYDPDKKVYTFDEFNSVGEMVHATGTFDGKVWTWSADLNMGGKAIKSHFILTEESPTSYSYKFEMSEDGTNFATVVDGTGKKSASAGTAKKKK